MSDPREPVMEAARRPDTASVLVTIDGGIARIVLNRPQVRNAVDDAMLAAFGDAVDAAASDPSCRVIVLSGAGCVFCAGWDLRSITATRERGDPEHARAQFQRNRQVLARYAAAPQATIALVHGAVVGFAVSLLVRSNIVIAAPGTRLSVPELSHGVVPAMVMRDLARTLPGQLALDWMLSGEVRDVEEGIRGGLITRCAADDLEVEGMRLARRIAGLDADAVRETKALYQRLEQLDEEAAVAESIEVAVRALTSAAD